MFLQHDNFEIFKKVMETKILLVNFWFDFSERVRRWRRKSQMSLKMITESALDSCKSSFQLKTKRDFLHFPSFRHRHTHLERYLLCAFMVELIGCGIKHHVNAAACPIFGESVPVDMPVHLSSKSILQNVFDELGIAWCLLCDRCFVHYNVPVDNFLLHNSRRGCCCRLLYCRCLCW